MGERATEKYSAGIETALAIIDQAMRYLPAIMDTPQARAQLIAIGLQESRFEHRRQLGGPAHGFWQFEKNGGVRGVLTHSASCDLARYVCMVRKVGCDSESVYQALKHDDILACCFARLLLYTDPRALPELFSEQAAWDTYFRVWRPGKPHRVTWGTIYEASCDAVVSAVG